MSEPKKEGIFKSFKNLPIDSIPKTVLVAVVLCGCGAFWKNFRRTAVQTGMTYMRCIAKVVIGLTEHVDPDGKPWSEMYKRSDPQSDQTGDSFLLYPSLAPLL